MSVSVTMLADGHNGFIMAHKDGDPVFHHNKTDEPKDILSILNLAELAMNEYLESKKDV